MRLWNWKRSRLRHEFVPPDRKLSARFFSMADHFAGNTPRVEACKIFFHARCEERNVRDLAKMFGDEPDRLVGRHPMKLVEARKVYRTRIATQRALESQIEINIEIAHRQLA